jgi:hypothetical protein
MNLFQELIIEKNNPEETGVEYRPLWEFLVENPEGAYNAFAAGADNMTGGVHERALRLAVDLRHMYSPGLALWCAARYADEREVQE